MSKFKKIALSTVVLAAVAYSGASWYMGQQFKKQTEPANTQELVGRIQSMLVGSPFASQELRLERTRLSSGVFSSQGEFLLGLATDDGSTLTPDNALVLNVDVTHGPFPLSALGHGVFSPQMGVVNITLSKDQLAKLNVTLTGDAPPELSMIVGFQSSYQWQLTLPSLAINDGKTQLELTQGLSGNGRYQLNDQRMDSRIHLPALAMTMDDGTVHLKNAQFELNNRQENKFSMSVDSLVFNRQQDGRVIDVKLSSLSMGAESIEHGEKADLRSSILFSNLSLNDISFGAMDLLYGMNNLDKSELNQLFSPLSGGNSLARINTKEAEFVLPHLRWTRNEQRAELSGMVKLADQSNNAPSLIPTNILSRAELNLLLPMRFGDEMFADVARLQAIQSPELNSEELLNRNRGLWKKLVEMGLSSHVFLETTPTNPPTNALKMTLKFENGVGDINGQLPFDSKDVSSAIMSVFFMMALMSAGG